MRGGIYRIARRFGGEFNLGVSADDKAHCQINISVY